jgi:hypothetical protein
VSSEPPAGRPKPLPETPPRGRRLVYRPFPRLAGAFAPKRRVTRWYGLVGRFQCDRARGGEAKFGRELDRRDQVRRAPAGRSVRVYRRSGPRLYARPAFYIDRRRKRDSEVSLRAMEGGSHAGDNELVESGIQPDRAKLGLGSRLRNFSMRIFARAPAGPSQE